ncbi:MAG: nitroreductase family deazaflavin-dependent oxidoreductase [Rubrobacteraceae bacterium]|nr:nitroreductase family deazaflavin-dependent oxidoreductase [Rubrobacteraceae bacterium]
MPQAPDQRPAVERVKPPETIIRIANPIFGWILISPLHGLVDEHLLLLHFRGRKTGRAYTVVAGHRTVDGRLGVLTNSGWRVNFRGGAPVEVTLEGERRRGRADLVENPEEVARVYTNLIEEYGYEKAGRRLGIRINVGRPPAHEELLDLVRRSGLSLVTIDLDATS